MSRLVFDTSPLSHFARADELTTLEAITSADERLVTRAVLDELARGSQTHGQLSAISDLQWLSVVSVDSLPELQVFAEYARRLGSGDRDIGEASTLAWAEVHTGIAIVDERAGTRHARERGVDVHGTLWLIAQGVRAKLLDGNRSEHLVDALRDAEAWFPSFDGGFIEWARENGLL